jgi:hypothetical protein
MGIDPVLLARTGRRLSDDEVRDLAVEMCVGLGLAAFMVIRGHCSRHALWRCEPADIEFVVDADGNPIDNGTGDILRVGLRTRYYGVDYERGHWPEIANAAQWVESRLPGTMMWYGADDDEHVAPLGPQERADMWRHFAANGNRPYDGGIDRTPGPKCRCCERDMQRAHLGDCDGTRYYCQGCGYSMLTHSNGRVVLAEYALVTLVRIATDDEAWANYEKLLTGELATSVAAEMCGTPAGLLVALMCDNPKIRQYAATAGLAATIDSPAAH